MAEQVYGLTHNKACYEKEFIDFSFAGKHISEFGWVAVSDGDRYSLYGSAPFEDVTSEVNGVDGQYYWGSRYKAFEIKYKIATDGVTEAQLAAMKRHFQPGKYGELSDCYHIGRVANARVNQQIEFTVVPFRSYTGKTRSSVAIHELLYKGEATVSFALDYPFWQISTHKFSHTYANLTVEEEFEMLQSNVLPSDTKYDNAVITSTSMIIGDNSSVTLPSSSSSHMRYYNPSIIDTPAIITLLLPNTVATGSTVNYITTFADSINGNKYHKLINYSPATSTATETTISTFTFTAPSFYYNLNRAVQVLNSMDASNMSLVDFEESMREEILDMDVMDEVAKFISMCIAGQSHAPSGVTVAAVTTSSGVQIWGTGWQAAWTTYLTTKLLPFSTSKPAQVVLNTKDSTSTYSYYYYKAVAPTDLTTGNWTLVEQYKTGKKCGEIALSKYLYLEGGDIITIVDSTTTTSVPTIAPTHALKLCYGDNNTQVSVTAQVSYNYLYV